MYRAHKALTETCMANPLEEAGDFELQEIAVTLSEVILAAGTARDVIQRIQDEDLRDEIDTPLVPNCVRDMPTVPYAEENGGKGGEA